MANKHLKTLTIGNTSMDIHDTPTMIRDLKNINISNMNYVTGGTVTVTEAGLYFIFGSVTFKGSASTGARYSSLALAVNNGGIAADGQQQPNGSTQVEKSLSTVWIINESDLPATISVKGNSSLAVSNCPTDIRAYKLYDI